MSRAATGLAAAALLASCSVLQPPPPDAAHAYLLEPVLAAGAPRMKHGLVVAVSAPRALSGYDTPRMAYTERPHTLEYFAKNRWVDAPARMLAPLLAQALERSGGFSAVVTAPGAAAAQLRLDTELVRLLQDFDSRPSRIRIALRAQLLEVGERRVLASAEFEETENAPSDDPNGGVIAANRALARLLGRVAEFCASAARGRETAN
jgi:cholesterol transport system auxiliary component